MGAIAQCLHTFSVLQDDLHRAMLNEIHAVTFPPFNIQIITQYYYSLSCTCMNVLIASKLEISHIAENIRRPNIKTTLGQRLVFARLAGQQ